MSKKTLFITGHSNGLGRALAREYLARGWAVRALSRRRSGLAGDLTETCCDLRHLEKIYPAVDELLADVQDIELAILNAGVLGRIRDMTDTALAEIAEVMDINVWANKLILDRLCEPGPQPRQIVLISSGAAVNGNKGWGAYSLSKAALNMLTKLYAQEFSASTLIALAPGLVDTAMQDYLCDPEQVEASRFPSVGKLRAARGTEAMPTPEAAARRIADIIPETMSRPSGQFLDLRDL